MKFIQNIKQRPYKDLYKAVWLATIGDKNHAGIFESARVFFKDVMPRSNLADISHGLNKQLPMPLN